MYVYGQDLDVEQAVKPIWLHQTITSPPGPKSDDAKNTQGQARLTRNGQRIHVTASGSEARCFSAKFLRSDLRIHKFTIYGKIRLGNTISISIGRGNWYSKNGKLSIPIRYWLPQKGRREGEKSHSRFTEHQPWILAPQPMHSASAMVYPTDDALLLVLPNPPPQVANFSYLIHIVAYV